MNAIFIAVILGIVEGLTEYLPVSSTGHLILVSRWLGEVGKTSAAFNIVIQFGAILAVIAVYGRLLAKRARGLFRGEVESRHLLTALTIGFLPAAVVGLGLHHAIKEHLFGPLPVASALIVGGLVMIGVERYRRANAIVGEPGLSAVTPRRALAIGIGQCFALWPGASRSMCTIVAGQLSGLATETAAEFSFLLGLPTLGAACLYEAWRSRHELALAPDLLVIGLVVSFAVAWVVVGLFIRYLQRRGLEPFGYYRLALGALVLWLNLS